MMIASVDVDISSVNTESVKAKVKGCMQQCRNGRNFILEVKGGPVDRIDVHLPSNGGKDYAWIR